MQNLFFVCVYALFKKYHLFIDTYHMANKKQLKKVTPRAPVISISSLTKKESEHLLRTILWDFFSITRHLDKIRTYWGGMIGITGPQWNILMAIDHLDEGKGVSVGEIANKLHVNSTFVTAQTKIMENFGHLQRLTSESDRRVILVSLTQSSINELNGFYKQRKQVNGMVFGNFSAREFRRLADQIEGIRVRVEQALDELDSDIR